MILSNFHTHTSFCDGKDSAEELVLRAIELGCSEIGFSGHSFVEFDQEFCMSITGTEEYKKEIIALREKYADKIKILLGVEQDIYSEQSTEDYDYIIGSVHYILKDNEYLFVDFSRQRQIDDVNKHYGGDFYAYIEDYYKLVGELYEKTRCNIIGHFDLVTKFNENGDLFDIKHPRYIKAAEGALKRLENTPAIFEINMGAISRGYRSEAYPSDFIRAKVAELDKPFVVNSDAHSAQTLFFGIEDEMSKLKDRGYKYITSLYDFLK